MSWEKPEFVDICLSMEATSYSNVSADDMGPAPKDTDEEL